MTSKDSVKHFWENASCGEELYLGSKDYDGYLQQSRRRYELEGDLIFPFASFKNTKNLKVLEIGVGLGSDHQLFAEAGAELYGIDLTARSIMHTSQRFKLLGLKSSLEVSDAENLDFEDENFDVVYSWGVIHHSPKTQLAINEIYRVLRPGGEAKIMIYHKWSILGLMLWIRYALLTLKPWRSLNYIYSNYLESPGTKAYSVIEATSMFSEFSSIKIRTPLTHGDLLESEAGQRHRGILLTLVKMVWPRRIIKRFLPDKGLFMLISAYK